MNSVKDGVMDVLPLTGVLASALAVEIVPAWYTCPSVETRVGRAWTDADLTVAAHEQCAALTEITYGKTKGTNTDTVGFTYSGH